MSDMTYPVQQEDHEMTSIRQVFDKVLNTVADATRLAKDVEQLKVSVNELQSSVDGYRRKIADQDQQILHLRDQRDAATTENWQIKSDMANLKTRNAELESRQNDSVKTISDLQETVARLRRECDDYAMSAMEQEEKARVAEAKLDKIQEALGQLPSNVSRFPAVEEVKKEADSPFVQRDQGEKLGTTQADTGPRDTTTLETPKQDSGQEKEELRQEWPFNIAR